MRTGKIALITGIALAAAVHRHDDDAHYDFGLAGTCGRITRPARANPHLSSTNPIVPAESAVFDRIDFSADPHGRLVRCVETLVVRSQNQRGMRRQAAVPRSSAR